MASSESELAAIRSRVFKWVTENVVKPPAGSESEQATFLRQFIDAHLPEHGLSGATYDDAGRPVPFRRCSLNPCRLVGVAFLMFELTEYEREVNSWAAREMREQERLARTLSKDVPPASHKAAQRAQFLRSQLQSSAFRVEQTGGRRANPLGKAFAQHLCWNGFSVAEAAALLGISEDAVRKRCAGEDCRTIAAADGTGEAPSTNHGINDERAAAS